MKSKQNLLISALLLCAVSTVSHGQKFIVYGDKTFGGDKKDQGMGIIKCSSYEFILYGHSNTDVSGDKTDPLCDTLLTNKHSDVWLLKIDTGLNILWDKSLGGYAGDGDPRMLETRAKGQMIFSCSSSSDSACEKTEHNRNPVNYGSDYWVCVVDSAGNRVWDITLGGDDGSDIKPSIIQLTTGEFIVCGETKSPVSGDKTVPNHTYNGFAFNDFWCIKLDSMGNKIWDKVYGGPENDYTSMGFDMLACPGGGFIIAGVTASDSGYEISTYYKGLYDIWIMKADSGGNKVWDRRYGGSKNNAIADIISTNNGGYILCGGTNSPQGGDVSEPPKGDIDAWVIKLDSLGNKMWDHRYGGNKSSGANKIIEFQDGYLIGGTTDSDSSYDVTENSYGNGDYWIFKIDTAGNKIWDKRFGGNGHDVLQDFVVMPDSSIYLFGYARPGISPVKTDSGKADDDYWIIHFKYVDTISTGAGINEHEKENGFTVYPNPALDKFKVSGFPDKFVTRKFKVEEIKMFDLAGREVNQHQTSNPKLQNEIDISSLAPGLYFVQVKTQRGVYTQKVVKE